jgi:hypothetical protein
MSQIPQQIISGLALDYEVIQQILLEGLTKGLAKDEVESTNRIALRNKN